MALRYGITRVPTEEQPLTLTDLPPELRLKIYEYYLVEQEDRVRKRIILCPPKKQGDVTHLIARVNRILREETIPLLFKNVTIIAHILHSINLDFCYEWIDTVDEYALRWIRHYQLRTPWNWCDIHGRIFGCHECAHAILIDLEDEDGLVKLMGEDGRLEGLCSEMESHREAVKEIETMIEALGRIRGRPQMTKDCLREVLKLVEGFENDDEREALQMHVESRYGP